MFGLSAPGVLALLERMPGAARCSGYQIRYYRPEKGKMKPWKPPVNPTGCARSEPFCRDEIQSKAENNDPPVRGARGRADTDTTSGDSNANMATLAWAMQYRKSKQILDETICVLHSKIQGYGLFAKRTIEKGEVIIEYVGELIRGELCDKRENYYDSVNLGSYMFRIDEDFVVDATKCGSQARFVNHSCDPNCTSRIITVENKKKIMIFALRDVELGHELTYDYKFPIEDAKVPCYCGSKNCRGTMN